MTQTVTIELDGQYKVIADSGVSNTATIQVRGRGAVEVVVDDRTEIQRVIEGDEKGIVYSATETAQFSGWEGEIRARVPYGDNSSIITVILS